jgi:4-hydroxy-3-methylbut-2-enyl diphosphate reductase
VNTEALVVVAPLWIEARALAPALPGVRIARSGMGPRRAQAATRRLASELAPRALAVAGVCGALDPRLVPGDVVVACELRGVGAPIVLESAKPLARALEARGITVHLGPILCLARLADGRDRAALAATGAIAVDMESVWLGPLRTRSSFAVLRVVSDGPGHELFRPAILSQGIRALRALRAAAPALITWAQAPEETH